MGGLGWLGSGLGWAGLGWHGNYFRQPKKEKYLRHNKQIKSLSGYFLRLSGSQDYLYKLENFGWSVSRIGLPECEEPFFTKNDNKRKQKNKKNKRNAIKNMFFWKKKKTKNEKSKKNEKIKKIKEEKEVSKGYLSRDGSKN